MTTRNQILDGAVHVMSNPDPAEGFAARVVATVLPALAPTPQANRTSV